jgi:hypothetical protein
MVAMAAGALILLVDCAEGETIALAGKPLAGANTPISTPAKSKSQIL